MIWSIYREYIKKTIVLDQFMWHRRSFFFISRLLELFFVAQTNNLYHRFAFFAQIDPPCIFFYENICEVYSVHMSIFNPTFEVNKNKYLSEWSKKIWKKVNLQKKREYFLKNSFLCFFSIFPNFYTLSKIPT